MSIVAVADEHNNQHGWHKLSRQNFNNHKSTGTNYQARAKLNDQSGSKAASIAESKILLVGLLILTAIHQTTTISLSI